VLLNLDPDPLLGRVVCESVVQPLFSGIENAGPQCDYLTGDTIRVLVPALLVKSREGNSQIGDRMRKREKIKRKVRNHSLGNYSVSLITNFSCEEKH
jgi:hypothetical protein